MKYLFIFFPVLFYTSICLAQFNWINPLPQGNTLNSVYFVDGQNGWAVGEHGTLLKTTDGGNNWQIIPSPLTDDLQDVFFVDHSHGWAVGKNGKILICNSGNWRIADSVTYRDLHTVAFIDSLHGVACGKYGILLYSQDGGESWLELPNASQSTLFAVEFANESTGYVAGGGGTAGGPGVILKTTDGGKHWQVMADDLAESIYDMAFIDSLTGYVAGNFSYIAKTTDGGKVWETLENPNTVNSYHIRSICFTDEQTGFTADIFGNFMKTVNAGQDWEVLPYISPSTVFSMTEYQEDHLTMVGGGGLILSSDNLGESFVNHRIGYGKYFNNLFQLNDQTLYGVGEEMLAKSFDGGTTWAYDSVGEMNLLVSSHFLTKDIGFVLSYNGKYKTLDGGENWIEMNAPKSTWLTRIYMKNELEGYITGGGQSPGGATWASCLKTTDGMNWEEANIPADRALNGVYFINDEEGFIYGVSGLLLKTTDDGENWMQIDPGTSLDLQDMVFTGDSTGFIIGSFYQNGNVILKTKDKGETWNSVYSDNQYGFEGYLNSIKFHGNQHGYVVGNSGRMLQTSDGGENWEIMEGFTSNSLFDILLLNDTSGIVGGNYGTLASFGEYSTSVPGNTIQNRQVVAYPNPFDQTLNFRFFNSSAQQLTIEIFDLSGKSVYLKQQHVGFGKIVIRINDFSVPSGSIFFFRITGNHFHYSGKVLRGC